MTTDRDATDEGATTVSELRSIREQLQTVAAATRRTREHLRGTADSRAAADATGTARLAVEPRGLEDLVERRVGLPLETALERVDDVLVASELPTAGRTPPPMARTELRRRSERLESTYGSLREDCNRVARALHGDPERDDGAETDVEVGEDGDDRDRTDVEVGEDGDDGAETDVEVGEDGDDRDRTDVEVGGDSDDRDRTDVEVGEDGDDGGRRDDEADLDGDDCDETDDVDRRVRDCDARLERIATHVGRLDEVIEDLEGALGVDERTTETVDRPGSGSVAGGRVDPGDGGRRGRDGDADGPVESAGETVPGPAIGPGGERGVQRGSGRAVERRGSRAGERVSRQPRRTEAGRAVAPTRPDTEFEWLANALVPGGDLQALSTLPDAERDERWTALEACWTDVDDSDREALPGRREGEATDPPELLRTATELARQTPFDAETLYGVDRTTGELDRDWLAASDADALASAVETATERGLVDVQLDGLADRLRRDLERLRAARELDTGTEVEFTVALETASGEPLSETPVEVQDVDDESARRTFRSGADGTVTVPFIRSEEEPGDARRFRLTARNSVGAVLLERTVEVADEETAKDGIASDEPDEATGRTAVEDDGDEPVRVGPGETVTLVVPVRSPGFTGAATLGSLETAAGFDLPALEDVQHGTLADVRRAGGVEQLAGATDLEPGERERIDGVATLDLMTDVETAASLVDAGFTDQVRIARTPLPEFREAVGDSLDPDATARIHTTARAQSAMLDVAMTEERTARRNGIAGEAATRAREEVTDDVE